jgi:hypothetical protein
MENQEVTRLGHEKQRHGFMEPFPNGGHILFLYPSWCCVDQRVPFG